MTLPDDSWLNRSIAQTTQDRRSESKTPRQLGRWHPRAMIAVVGAFSGCLLLLVACLAWSDPVPAVSATPLTVKKATPQVPQAPLTVYLDNDQSVTVTVSRTEMNRLFVADDPIVRWDAPAHRVVVRHDESGSVLLSVAQSAPLTVFISTQHGRHFSVRLVPEARPGMTIKIVSPRLPSSSDTTKNPRAPTWETRLMHRLKTVLNGEVPAGDRVMTRAELVHRGQWQTFAVPTYVRGYPMLTQEVVSVTLGPDAATRILRVTWHPRYHRWWQASHAAHTPLHALVLPESAFAAPGVQAVALSQRQLRRDQSLWVYEVLHAIDH